MGSLQALYKFEMPSDEFESYVKEEENRVIAKLEESARPCPGATEEVEKLYKSGKYGLAVVSSSALRRVLASIRKVGQDKYFNPSHVFSAASSLPKPTSKPDPAIYLHVLDVLKTKPENALTVEDSKSGILSAVRAGIPAVGYVGPYEGQTKKAEMTKALRDAGARVVMGDWSEFPSCLQQIEAEQ